MQIQKKMALAYFHWSQTPRLTGEGLPDFMDLMDFKYLLQKQICVNFNGSVQTLFDQLVKREEQFAEKNIHLLFPADDSYPSGLNYDVDSKDRPVLCVQGILPKNKVFITVVGSRTPSVDSLRWMHLELALALRHQNIALISGAARGVDQEAHELALANDVPTLAFLPCGIDYVYPDSFLRLRKAVMDQGGAIISGFAPWEKMRKSFFHQRNEWMVAMSKLVLVIEAQRGGGSWMSGNWALEKGITTGVVPVHPLSSWGLGNNDLLHVGNAHLIRDSGDIIGLL